MKSDEELRELNHQRRDAIQRFLDENAALFSSSTDEFDDDDEPLAGPVVLEKWIVLTCERNLGAIDKDFFVYGRYYSEGIGRHELLGLLQMEVEHQS